MYLVMAILGHMSLEHTTLYICILAVYKLFIQISISTDLSIYKL